MHEHARGREPSREKGVIDEADKRGHNVRSQIHKMVTDGINNIPSFLDREGHISFVASRKGKDAGMSVCVVIGSREM